MNFSLTDIRYYSAVMFGVLSLLFFLIDLSSKNYQYFGGISSLLHVQSAGKLMPGL
jgi:hypothetical protein